MGRLAIRRGCNVAVTSGAGDVFVALDLEMTGARADSQEVVEVAAVKFRGDRVLATFSRLVRPRAQLAYGVQVLTGIRPADLGKAPPLSEVAPFLVDFVEGLPIVGQSVANDIVPCGRAAGLRPTTWATVAAVAPAPTSAATCARRFGLFEVPDI